LGHMGLEGEGGSTDLAFPDCRYVILELWYWNSFWGCCVGCSGGSLRPPWRTGTSFTCYVAKSNTQIYSTSTVLFKGKKGIGKVVDS
jgi:hypothetical protein